MPEAPLFTREFQANLLAAMLVNRDLFNDVKSSKLTHHDFSVPAIKFVYEVALSIHSKTGILPSVDILSDELIRALNNPPEDVTTEIDESEIEILSEVVGKIYTARSTFSGDDVEYYRRWLPDFVLNSRFKYYSSTAMSNEERIEAGKKAELDASLFRPTKVTMYNAATRPRKREGADAVRLGLGVYNLDRLSCDLAKQQQGVIVACPGVGKTGTLCNIAVTATFRGYHSLFITLENPGDMILRRIQCSVAHVDARAHSPSSKIPLDVKSLERLEYVMHPDHPISTRVTIADGSKDRVTVLDIENLIRDWKRGVKEVEGTDEGCFVVCVDWLDKLDADGCPGVDRNTSEPNKLTLLNEALGYICRRQDVAIWTATQGTRDAVRREVLGMNHTANSYHIHDPADVSIGIATTIVDDELHDDDEEDESPPCNRYLTISIMKARESSIAGRVVRIYQGPSLRMWDSEDDYNRATRLADQGKLEEIYNVSSMRRRPR